MMESNTANKRASSPARNVGGASAAAPPSDHELLDLLTELVYRADPETLTALYVNAAVREIYGYTPAEWLADPGLWERAIHPDDRARVLSEFREAQQRKAPGLLEYRVRRRDGSIRWVQDRFTWIADERGEQVALVGAVADISERKEAQEQLRERERQLSGIISNLPGAVFRVRNDPNYTAEYVSDRIAELTGYPADDFRENRRTFGDLMHVEDREWVWKETQEALAERRPYEVTYRFIDAHGRVRWNWERGTGVHGATGELQAVEGFVQDVTERVNTLAALRESQSRLAFAMGTARMGSWSFHLDTGQAEADAASLALHGFAEGEAVTALDQGYRHVHPDDVPEARRRIEQAIQTRGTYENEYRVVLSGGDIRWIHAVGSVPEGGQYMIGMVQDITARKLAEEELRKAFETRDFVIAGTGTGLWDWNLATNQMRYSREWKQMLGYAEHEVADDLDAWRRLTHPDDTEPTLARIAAFVQRPSGVLETEFRMRHKSGQFRWILSRATAQLGADGNPGHLLGLHTDITDRKEADRALHSSEARFSNAFHSSPAGMTITRIADGRFVDANEAFCSVFEFTREEVIGRTSPELKMWTPEERERVIEAQVATGGLTDFELRARTRSGAMVSLLLSSRLLELEGEPHLVTTMIDISRRRAAELAVREALDRVENLVRTAPGIVCSLQLKSDGAMCFPYGSDRLEQLLGIARGTLAADASPAFELVHPADLARVRAAISESARSLAPFRSEWRVLLSGCSERWLDVHAIPRAEPDSRIVWHGVVTDITAQKEADAAVHLSRKALRALAGRLVAIREEERTLLSREIHDSLGQALTGLKMDLAWIISKVPRASAPVQERVHEMNTLLDQSVQLVRDLSARLRPAALDDIGLAAAIEHEVIEFTRRSAIAVHYDPPEAALGLAGSQATALFRICQEALTNIARHAHARNVVVHLRAQANEAVLDVVDDGRGIAERAIHATASLGLIGMRERALACGGFVEIHREPRGGTKLTARVPLAAPPPHNG